MRLSDAFRQGCSLNRDTEDYGSYATARKPNPVVAYCDSDRCCSRKAPRKAKLRDGTVVDRVTTIRKVMVLKDVEKNVDFCPDCYRRLIWMPENKLLQNGNGKK